MKILLNLGKEAFTLVRRQKIIDDYPPHTAVQRRYELLQPILDERLRRLWAAAEALAFGPGGIATLSEATGLSRTTIRAGIEELKGSERDLAILVKEGRVRRPGGGRRSVVEQDATLEADLESLLESSQEDSRVLDWTCKSIRTLAAELSTKGHQVSYRTVGNLLHRSGFRFSPTDGSKRLSLSIRQEQFHRLSHQADSFLRNDEPVVALEFIAAAPQHLIVPTTSTAGLGVAALRHWRLENASMGDRARRLLLLLDTAGLPAGDRSIWTPLLQPFVDDAGMEILVAHFPPGARRWHRSAQEMKCSWFGPLGAADPVLTIALEQVRPPEGRELRGLASSQGTEEPSYDGIWNYRIKVRP